MDGQRSLSPPASAGTSRRRRIRAAALSLLAVAAPFAPPAQAASKGNFHVGCGFVKSAKIDPIVFPRRVGLSHLHYFFGNRSTNARSTRLSMMRASTLCSFKADTGGYWTPALVSPSGAVIRPVRLTVYYRSGSGPGRVSAPPGGLKMIAGGNTHNLNIAGYKCGGDGNPTSSVPIDCGSQLLKGAVIFPSCWDGRRLDSANHRAHLAYPSGKGCPVGHRVRIPKIIFNITYGIHNGRGYYLVSDHQMGMMHGMSLHADFWNTWDQKALVSKVNVCINGGQTCDL